MHNNPPPVSPTRPRRLWRKVQRPLGCGCLILLLIPTALILSLCWLLLLIAR